MWYLIVSIPDLCTLTYLDATLLYPPGDDTDSSVLLDMGNDHILLDNVDDKENNSQSGPGDQQPNPQLAGQVGRSICLLGFWISLSRAPDHISLCIVWLPSMLVLYAYMYESVYGKSVHISL